MPSSHRTAGCLALLAPFFLLLAACGGGGSAQNRPQLVGSFPGNQQALTGTLSALRLDYDVPVTLLNPASVLVVADGIQISTISFQVPSEPSAVFVVPSAAATFRPGSLHTVVVFQGIVINAEDHYPLDEESFVFTLGPDAPLAAGAPQAVKIYDRDTFALLDTVPTPNAGTDTAVGVLSTQSDTGRRYWVQRSDPGGGANSFAYFDAGDAAMTEVPLTLSMGSTSHVSDAAALALGPRGEFLYVAYREEGGQLVRLSRIDVTTATETASILLSPTAGASTAPTGLALSTNREELVVACREGAAGRMVCVDVNTFTEIDRDTTALGTQGVPLPHPPGQVATFASRYITTAFDGSGTANAQHVVLPTYTVAETASGLVGTGNGSLASLDAVLAVQPVSGYANNEALAVRTFFSGYSTATPFVVSDDVGGAPTNTTTVLTAARYTNLDRFLLVHDGGILTRWLWSGFLLVQEDLDDVTDGIQAVDGGVAWADVVTISRDAGQFPLP